MYRLFLNVWGITVKAAGKLIDRVSMCSDFLEELILKAVVKK